MNPEKELISLTSSSEDEGEGNDLFLVALESPATELLGRLQRKKWPPK